MGRKDTRLDIAMVERGLVENRSKARAMILAGDVLVDDAPVTRAGAPVPTVIFFHGGGWIRGHPGERNELL